MKIENMDDEEFQPLTLILTLETEQEAILLRNLTRISPDELIRCFNHINYVQDPKLKKGRDNLLSDLSNKLSKLLNYEGW